MYFYNQEDRCYDLKLVLQISNIQKEEKYIEVNENDVSQLIDLIKEGNNYYKRYKLI